MPEAALRLDSSWISAFAGMTTSSFYPTKGVKKIHNMLFYYAIKFAYDE
ncbi:Uncharacterised protein [Legionella spiritensis]|nr:Uncharacterised protein [Legionella spiritensis]